LESFFLFLLHEHSVFIVETLELGEKYAGKIPKDMIRLLDGCRTSRHSTQYDVGYYPPEEEARELIKFSEEFMEKIRQIIQ